LHNVTTAARAFPETFIACGSTITGEHFGRDAGFLLIYSHINFRKFEKVLTERAGTVDPCEVSPVSRTPAKMVEFSGKTA
jgi:hypothetical protein